MRNHPTHHLDARAPLVLDTRDLPRSPGSMREVHRVVPAPKDLGLALIGVPAGSDLALDLTMQSVTEGVYVSGHVSGPLAGECGRCLRPIEDTVDVDIAELYAYADSTTDETAEEDEVGRIEGDLIDLEPVVRDAVVGVDRTRPRQDARAAGDRLVRRRRRRTALAVLTRPRFRAR